MRCEIAATFLHNPKILFLDEPTIGLDVLVKENIRKFIKEINKEKNTTVILTTHDLKDIEDVCDRIILLDNGKIIYDGGYIGAFNNIDLLNIAKIDVPFVAKMKNKFNIKKECRTIKELANLIRGDSL